MSNWHSSQPHNLNMVCRQNNMNAVERIFQYSGEGVIPQEAAYEVNPSPPPSWPERGEVEFKDVVLRFE